MGPPNPRGEQDEPARLELWGAVRQTGGQGGGTVVGGTRLR